MKEYIKSVLKILVILIASIMLTYLILTVKDLLLWYDEMQFDYIEKGKSISEIDENIFDDLGMNTYEYIDSVKDEIVGTELEKYNVLGLAIWQIMFLYIKTIIYKNISFSIFFGILLTIAYIVITNKRMSNFTKFLIGYISIIIVFPPLYMYSYTGRFWDLATMYIHSMSKYFYIIYTILFFIIYIVNYKINSRISKELNEALKKKE